MTHTTYTIKVTRAHNDTIDGIIDKIQDNSSGATCINSGTTLYSTLDAAIANMGTLTVDAADDLSIVWDGTSYTATYRSYSNTTDLEAAVGADISYPFWETPVANLNEYLVIKVTNGSTGFTLADNCNHRCGVHCVQPDLNSRALRSWIYFLKLYHSSHPRAEARGWFSSLPSLFHYPPIKFLLDRIPLKW